MLWHASHRFFLRHPAQCLLALAGMTGGIAVMTGVLLLHGVLADSLDRAGEALIGREHLRIVSPASNIADDQYARLARISGAPDMQPLIRERVRIDDRPFQVLGVDAIAWTVLMERDDAVVLPATTAQQLDVTAGDALVLVHQGRELALHVAAVAPMYQGFDGHILMDIAAAQVLFGRAGRIDELLAPADSADWLAQHRPESWTVQAAEARRDVAGRLTRSLRVNLFALSLLALAVGLFVVYSVLNFLFVQRKKDFGVLRALGVRPAQLAGVMVREALLLGAIGGLLGIWLGTWLAAGLLHLIRDPVAEIYRGLPALTAQGGFGLYLGIVAAGITAALIATAPVIREAVRLPPLHWLRSSPPPIARAAGWPGGGLLILTLAGIACIALSKTLIPAQIGLFLLLASFALAAPTIGLFLLGTLARLTRLRALKLLAAGAQRIRPALAALGLAIAVSAGIGMMVAGFRAGVDDWISRLLRADAYVTLQQGVIDGAIVQYVETLPEIAATSAVRRVRLTDGRDLVAYDLPDAAWDGFEWMDSGPELIEPFRAGQAVMISEPFARAHNISVGESVTLPAVTGMLHRPVAGIFRDYSSERGFIAVDGVFYRTHWRDEVRDNLGLYFAPDIRFDAGTAAVESALDERAPRITPAAEIKQQTLAIFDRTFRITAAMRLLVGLIALIALVSSLLALALERSRDYATLRALGMTRLHLGALVTLQTTGLALIAALLAVPLALLVHWVLVGVIQPRAFGWTVPVTWPWQILPVTAAWALLAGFLAGLYPAWRIARQPPARSLRR